MGKRILLAYATNYGSTREVAEKLTEILKSQGLDVDLQPAHTVRSLKDYDAVVLGAPLILYRWHKKALRFLNRHKKDLTQIPIAIFALGPTFKNDAVEWRDSHKQLDEELGHFDWLEPAAREVFGGKYDPDKVNSLMRASMRDFQAADLRDWQAIEDWGNKLAEIFSGNTPE